MSNQTINLPAGQTLTVTVAVGGKQSHQLTIVAEAAPKVKEVVPASALKALKVGRPLAIGDIVVLKGSQNLQTLRGIITTIRNGGNGFLYHVKLNNGTAATIVHPRSELICVGSSVPQRIKLNSNHYVTATPGSEVLHTSNGSTVPVATVERMLSIVDGQNRSEEFRIAGYATRPVTRGDRSFAVGCQRINVAAVRKAVAVARSFKN
jgi:hypothetical protein